MHRWRASFATSAALSAWLLGGKRLVLLALFTGMLFGENAYKATHQTPLKSGFYIQLPGLSDEEIKINKLEDLVESVGVDHERLIAKKDFKQL